MSGRLSAGRRRPVHARPPDRRAGDPSGTLARAPRPRRRPGDPGAGPFVVHRAKETAWCGPRWARRPAEQPGRARVRPYAVVGPDLLLRARTSRTPHRHHSSLRVLQPGSRVPARPILRPPTPAGAQQRPLPAVARQASQRTMQRDRAAGRPCRTALDGVLVGALALRPALTGQRDTGCPGPRPHPEGRCRPARTFRPATPRPCGPWAGLLGGKRIRSRRRGPPAGGRLAAADRPTMRSAAPPAAPSPWPGPLLLRGVRLIGPPPRLSRRIGSVRPRHPRAPCRPPQELATFKRAGVRHRGRSPRPAQPAASAPMSSGLDPAVSRGPRPAVPGRRAACWCARGIDRGSCRLPPSTGWAPHTSPIPRLSRCGHPRAAALLRYPACRLRSRRRRAPHVRLAGVGVACSPRSSR